MDRNGMRGDVASSYIGMSFLHMLRLKMYNTDSSEVVLALRKWPQEPQHIMLLGS